MRTSGLTSGRIHCPHCQKSLSKLGGGVKNHIWRNSSCAKKEVVFLTSRSRILAAQIAAGRRRGLPAGSSHVDGPRSEDREVDYGDKGLDIGNSNDAFPYGEEPDFPDSDKESHPSSNAVNTLDGASMPTDPRSFRVEFDSGAGHILEGDTETVWESLLKEQTRENQPFAPWASEEEWEMVEWFLSSSLSQSDIDKFLKLKYVIIISY